MTSNDKPPQRLTFRQRIEQPILLNLPFRVFNAKSNRVVKKELPPVPQPEAPYRPGKERPPERPAKKKQSTLKKIILKERNDRSEMNQTDWKATDEGECSKKTDIAVFRDYCTNRRSHELDEDCCLFLQLLADFQARAYARNQLKARQIMKHLKSNQVKCVIIAPDCEPTSSEGGLDDLINQIVKRCEEQGVCCAFALNRKALGKCVRLRAFAAAVGVLDYSGAEIIFTRITEHVKKAAISEKVEQDQESIKSDETQRSAYLGMTFDEAPGHIRNLSDSFGILTISQRTCDDQQKIIKRPSLLAKHTRNSSAEVRTSPEQCSMMVSGQESLHSRNPSEISQTSQSGCVDKDGFTNDEYFAKMASAATGEAIQNSGETESLCTVLEEATIDAGNEADGEFDVY